MDICKKRCSIFIKRLYQLVTLEDNSLNNCVIWDNVGNKNGFMIINLGDFHEKCITNKITNSINFKSLFRQLNNYGFKYNNGFCYHPSGYFKKNSTNLKKIRYKDHVKLEKKIKKKEGTENSKDVRYSIINKNSDILLMTEEFLIDEMFKNIELPLMQDDFISLLDQQY
jgi:hypothetical protein